MISIKKLFPMKPETGFKRSTNKTLRKNTKKKIAKNFFLFVACFSISPFFKKSRMKEHHQK